MQLVGYEPVPDPAVSFAEHGAVTRVALEPGRELSYRLTDRHCAGTVQGDSHEPCPEAQAPFCEVHTVPWSIASNADSDEEHAVYLAAFAPATFKVGVTRTWRLETRLREQGADRAAHVFTVPDGRVARDVERDLAVDLPEQVRVETKIGGFDREVDTEAWESLLGEYEVRRRFTFDYGLELAGQPVAETMLAGTVRGVKGRVLVLDRDETTYAVDLRDLLGYEVEEGAPRDAQVSLGAWR